MHHCWRARGEDRPTFRQLAATLKAMLVATGGVPRDVGRIMNEALTGQTPAAGRGSVGAGAGAATPRPPSAVNPEHRNSLMLQTLEGDWDTLTKALF